MFNKILSSRYYSLNNLCHRWLLYWPSNGWHGKREYTFVMRRIETRSCCSCWRFSPTRLCFEFRVRNVGWKGVQLIALYTHTLLIRIRNKNTLHNECFQCFRRCTNASKKPSGVTQAVRSERAGGPSSWKWRKNRWTFHNRSFDEYDC